MRYLKAFAMILCLPVLLPAQQTSEMGLFVGLATYQGDLASSPISANETNLALGGTYRHLFSPKYGARLTANYAKLTGSDLEYVSRVGRGVKMENSVLEMAVHGEWHPMGQARYSNNNFFQRGFSPYLSVGMGIAFGTPDITVEAGSSEGVSKDETPSSFFILPISAGVRLDIKPEFSISLDIGSRPTFSDYFDGVSSNVVGNEGKDWYLIGGVTLLYIISSEVGEFDF